MSRLIRAPFALTSTGEVVLGVCHTDWPQEPLHALKRALASGARVFIGVELSADEVKAARTFLHDGLEEGAGYLGSAWR